MAWKELRGTRQITDNDPHNIDYEITFQGDIGDTKPSQGNTISDITGSGSLPSTGLFAEPDAQGISQVTKVTATKTRVKVRFRGEYVD